MLTPYYAHVSRNPQEVLTTRASDCAFGRAATKQSDGHHKNVVTVFSFRATYYR